MGNNATAGELKSYVEDLTKVPLSRQKYMVKGGLVDDSAKLVDVIKPGSTLMLLGTADAGLVSKPAEKINLLKIWHQKNNCKGVVIYPLVSKIWVIPVI